MRYSKIINNIIILITLFIFSGCGSDDNDELTQMILTINVGEESVSENTQLFYSIKGAEGQNLGFGELFNSDTVMIVEPYNGDQIALNVFRYTPSGNSANVISYLNLDLGQSVSIDNINSRPKFNFSSSGSFKFKNLSNDYRHSTLSTPGVVFYTYSTFNGNVMDGFPINDDFPMLLFSFVPINGNPEYQPVFLSPDQEREIDVFRSTEMEKINTVTFNLKDPTFLIANVDLYGRETVKNQTGDFLIYNSLTFFPNSNQIQFYSPLIFRDFKTRIEFSRDDISYTQTNIGGIPSTFESFDPALSIVSNDFQNFDFQVDNTVEFSSTGAFWRFIGQEGFIGWRVNSRESFDNKYRIHEIPDDLLESMEVFNELPSILPISVEARKYENLIYPFDQDIFGFEQSEAKNTLTYSVSFQ